MLSFYKKGDVSVYYEDVCDYGDDFFEDNEDDCEYDDFCVDNEDVLGGVVCEEHLNKSSIAGLRPFQNCRQVL